MPDRCSQIISPRLSRTLLFADDAEDASGGDDSLFSHENVDALPQRPDETLAGEGGISVVHDQLMHEKEERRREQEERRREQEERRREQAEMSTLKDQLRLMREKDAQQDQAR